jgi:hypothetical protein
MQRDALMIDYETPRFKSSDVASAAGMPAATFRSYFRRGQFRVYGDANLADTHGLPNLFSLRDALGFAVATALMRAGAEPKQAFEAGMLTFAHTGDEDRDPGRTYDIHEQGDTIMLFDPASGKARLEAVDGDISFHRLFVGAGDALLILKINPIEQRVFHVLDVKVA